VSSSYSGKDGKRYIVKPSNEKDRFRASAELLERSADGSTRRRVNIMVKYPVQNGAILKKANVPSL
jgi:hypothetical protein